MAAMLPEYETERLAALYEHRILDTDPDDDFDALVKLAAHICHVPIAAVSLLDEHRQWFKASIGLVDKETRRDIAFCGHTILQDGIFIVPDAQQDDRFLDNPLVTGDPQIRFYAGVPLVTADGHAVGSLCVIDQVPRDLTLDQCEALRLLARQASNQLAAVRRIVQTDRLMLERLAADQALQREREFQRALLDSLLEGIVACDATGTLTLFNQASRNFHGVPEEALQPEEWASHFDLFLSDGLTPMAVADIPLFRAFNGETIRAVEMVIAPQTGAMRTLLANGQPIYGSDGEKLGAVVAMHDVTERRRAERELSRLAAIVESSEDAIIAGTLDGTVTSWNKGSERLHGYSASEIIGNHVSVLSKGREPSLTPDRVAKLVRGETIPPIEFVRDRKDGTIMDVSLTFSSVRDDRGEVVGFSCIGRDITDRKRAETALAASEAALRAVLEGAPVILYAANAAGIVTLSEGTGLSALGLKPGEAVGRSVYDFSLGDPLLDGNTKRALNGESVSFDAEVAGVCLHTQLRSVFAADGAPNGFVGVCFDITERKRAEEQDKDYAVVLEHQKRELEQVNLQLEQVNTELAKLASTDGLTGLSNHRALHEQLTAEIQRAERYAGTVSLVMLDVDRFKQFNDTYGHPVGDEVLRSVANILRSHVREIDIVARYGGEEFVVALPQTEMDGAFALAERLRCAIEEYPWPLRAVTASFGVATIENDCEIAAHLIARADEALYRSKEAGRNRVTCADQTNHCIGSVCTSVE